MGYTLKGADDLAECRQEERPDTKYYTVYISLLTAERYAACYALYSTQHLNSTHNQPTEWPGTYVKIKLYLCLTKKHVMKTYYLCLTKYHFVRTYKYHVVRMLPCA
jgi:hypothetical protein